MSNAPQTPEVPCQNPDPVKLLQVLEGMDTDKKKFIHLRNLFLEEADVDEYVQYLDTDGDIDLTKRQLTKLKVVLDGYKGYLKEYLERTGKSLEKFDERFRKNVTALANPDLTPEEAQELARTRVSFSKAMKAVAAPRGAKGKSLREVTEKGLVSGVGAKNELTPEQVEKKWLGEFKTRFEALSQLHKGIRWADVEKSLKADPEAMKKLQALDEKGHKMNVFGEEKREFIFASGWSDCNEVSEDHRNITYDLEGQKLAEKDGYNSTGNAVDIASAMGVDLADPNFHEQLRKAIAVNGWAWLKTDAATRKTGYAFSGRNVGVSEGSAGHPGAVGSFRAALRVKKT